MDVVLGTPPQQITITLKRNLQPGITARTSHRWRHRDKKSSQDHHCFHTLVRPFLSIPTTTISEPQTQHPHPSHAVSKGDSTPRILLPSSTNILPSSPISHRHQSRTFPGAHGDTSRAPSFFFAVQAAMLSQPEQTVLLPNLCFLPPPPPQQGFSPPPHHHHHHHTITTTIPHHHHHHHTTPPPSLPKTTAHSGKEKKQYANPPSVPPHPPQKQTNNLNSSFPPYKTQIEKNRMRKRKPPSCLLYLREEGGHSFVVARGNLGSDCSSVLRIAFSAIFVFLWKKWKRERE